MSVHRSTLFSPAVSPLGTDAAAMVEALPEACVVTNLDGRIVCINDAATALFGHAPEALVGNDVSVLMTSSSATQHREHVARARAGELDRTRRRPLLGRHANGEPLRLLVSLSRVALASEDVFIALVEPHDSLSQVSEYIENAVDATVIITERGVVASFNAAAEVLFGRPRVDVIGRNVSLLMPRSFGVHHNNYLRRSSQARSGDERGGALGIRRPVYARTAAGEEFRVSIALSESWLGGRRLYTGVVTRVDQREETVHRDALERLLEEAVDASVVIDQQGLIAVFNKAAEVLFGFRKVEMVGRNVSTLMPPEYAADHDEMLRRFRDAKQADASRAVGMRRPVMAQTRDGLLMQVRIAVSELKLPGNNYFLGVISTADNDSDGTVTTHVIDDLVARRTRSMADQIASLRKLSSTDELTQLANRRQFNDTLDREVGRCTRSREAISLAMLDIDHFKLYNDEYGHPGGDACLKRVAACIRDVFRRAVDVPARYGGEEFAIIMSGTTYDNAVMLGNRLRERIASDDIAHAKSPTAPHVTVSVGVCTMVPGRGDTASAIVDAADAALYAAKEAGRDRVVGDDRTAT